MVGLKSNLEYIQERIKEYFRDFPGGPVVENPPSNAGDAGSIPGRGTRIPHAMGLLSPCAATTEPALSGACMPQLESPHATTREEPTCRNEEPALAMKDPACHN